MNGTSSQIGYIFEFIRVLLREMIRYKTWVILAFAVVSLAVLGMGLVFPKKYSSSSSVFADQQNIIKPLLEGQAATTSVNDQGRLVREVVMSPRLLQQVVIDLGLTPDVNNEYAMEAEVIKLRGGLNVENMGSNFIKLSYVGNDPNLVYNVISKVTDLFIKNASETKRKESSEAFVFIDKQVKTYKGQLQEAEERLKAFTSSNYDGSDQTVDARISGLRQEIETTKLNIEETTTRIASLEKELSSESQFVERRFRSDVYRERLMDAQSQLATLKLTYTDSHPDVVALQHQIEDMQRAIRDTDNRQNQSQRGNTDSNVNPLYERLRSDIASQKVEVDSMRRRLERTESLLKDEYARKQRIAAREAELAELNRDYNVNRSIYEDMLGRKERARLSMTLDVEGQGVTYRIQEPPVYPLTPTGLRFMHFFLVGPVLGFLVPIAVLGLYVQFDPRIRFRGQLEAASKVPILGVVPHMASPLAQRMMRSDVILLGGFFVIILCVYGAIAVARYKGIL
ncbi:MAG TPA: XrtA system polysaccharide chain length determinant [Dongiaceae bacterium]|nr:XrtA system polysaccharide chain length determinant [Dongiaceae bacterium]